MSHENILELQATHDSFLKFLQQLFSNKLVLSPYLVRNHCWQDLVYKYDGTKTC